MFLETMIDYLENCNEEFLSAVRKIMVLRFSRTYNKAPCVADIEKNIEEIYAVMSRPKPFLLEHKEPRATPEEEAMFLEQMRAMIKPGAMAKSLNNFINQLEGRNK